ncbi:hypothetical protein ACWFR1_27940 [Streptomyces sp. NPDC055103]
MTEDRKELRRAGAAKEWSEPTFVALFAAVVMLDDSAPWWELGLSSLFGLWALAGLVRATARRLRTRARARA